jgi:prepilin-type N-terminal cleavage/methylation domain-containing protein
MKKSSGGFTLIEVLIAVVILSVGIVAILQGMQTGMAALDEAVDKTRSAALIASRFSALQQMALSGQDFMAQDSQGNFEAPFDNYRWRQSIEVVPVRVSGDSGRAAGSEGGRLYRVEVFVWRDGLSRDYSLSTYIYETPDDSECDAESGGGTEVGQ